MTNLTIIDSLTARRRFGQLLDATLGGAVFIIKRYGRPVADLAPHGRLQRCEREVRELVAALAATEDGRQFLEQWRREQEERQVRSL